jgi:hypothetical protein
MTADALLSPQTSQPRTIIIPPPDRQPTPESAKHEMILTQSFAYMS